MTTADYALLVSLFSAATALGSLGWNIWSKFIYPKPRLRVQVAVVTIVDPARPNHRPQYVTLNTTNHGPIDVTINSASICTEARWPKRGDHALVNPIHDINFPDVGIGPFGGGLPKKLAVGEQFTLFFLHVHDAFARVPLSKFGVSDSFGRFHGATRTNIRRLKADLDEAFPHSAPRSFIHDEM